MRAARWPIALLLGAAMAIGVSACGGDDAGDFDVVPQTTPALTAPEDTSLPPVRTTRSTTTSSTSTNTTSTSTTPTGGATNNVTPTTTPTTGGTTTPAPTSTSTTTTPAGSGGLSAFCSQNPGACPGN